MIQKILPTVPMGREVFGNTLAQYGDALIVTIFFAVVFFILSLFLMRYFERIARKTKTELDNVLLRIISNMRPPFYFFIAGYLGLRTLNMAEVVERTIFVMIVLWVTWQVITALQLLIDYFVDRASHDSGDHKGLQAVLLLLSVLAKGGLWVIALLMILSNLGINITSLVAGLGIGGIAIAFAVKGILEDLFSSFSIYFDKPFEVGDLIAVDGEKGKVEKIGIKTTRLKSMMTGEEIVMTNKDLTTKKINNFHRMTRRRTSFDLGVTYETDAEMLKKIPEMIKEIITTRENVEFNRVHLRSFDDSAIRFTVLYHYLSREYEPYLNTHQDILFAIRDAFEEAEIDMAYPTQTIHIVKGDSN